jgi:hypothetical protein
MLSGQILVLFAKAEREGCGHAVRRRARTVDWAVRNEPLRPRLTSLSTNVSPRSIRRFRTKVIRSPFNLSLEEIPHFNASLGANLRRERDLVVRFHFDDGHNISPTE